MWGQALAWAVEAGVTPAADRTETVVGPHGGRGDEVARVGVHQVLVRPAVRGQPVGGEPV